MSATFIDTLAFSKSLQQAGFEGRQAEALATGLNTAIGDTLLPKLATKDDLKDLRGEMDKMRTELKSEIAEVRTELKSEIAEVRTELKADIASVRADLTLAIEKSRNQMVIVNGTIGAIIIGTILAVVRSLPATPAG